MTDEYELAISRVINSYLKLESFYKDKTEPPHELLKYIIVKNGGFDFVREHWTEFSRRFARNQGSQTAIRSRYAAALEAAIAEIETKSPE